MANGRTVQNLSSGRWVNSVRALLSSTIWIASGFSLVLLSTSCSIRRVVYNDTITTGQTQFIRTGQTTLLDVVDRLGAPDEITESESGVVALYNWSDTKSAAIDPGVLLRFFLPYSPSMTLTRTGIQPQQFLVVYDPQWTVRAYGFSRWPKEDPVVWFWPF